MKNRMIGKLNQLIGICRHSLFQSSYMLNIKHQNSTATPTDISFLVAHVEEARIAVKGLGKPIISTHTKICHIDSI